jgi:hypothetical protein
MSKNIWLLIPQLIVLIYAHTRGNMQGTRDHDLLLNSNKMESWTTSHT